MPTIDEILPSSSVQEPKKITRHTHQHTTANDKNPLKVKVPFTDDYSNDEDEQDPENLQSVESNHVDSYYEDVNDSAQGRSTFISPPKKKPQNRFNFYLDCFSCLKLIFICHKNVQ